jgi:serine/threonine-protein kinase
MLRRIEKYEIEEEIGHGGMASVYRARDTHLDRKVAVKIMHPHLRGAREARVRFTREARTVARLRHPNILEIYDYSGEDSPESYIATELLTGPTLKRFAEQHPDLPPEIAACMVAQIARALAVAHDHGIIHRDVKPENVLLHENRALKLTDFGIAQMVDAQSMTATGQVLGSPGHMAPEQVEGKECDARTDVFALGTVLYFLATGKLPFTGKNPHQILKRIVDGDFPDPQRLRPEIGARLRAIILKCLARDPADRYQSARELERACEEFAAEIGIEDTDAEVVRYLADPAGVTAELRRRAVERLTARGERALRAGDRLAAMADFDRVLAIDDGNARVLSALAREHRRSRLRTLAFWSGSGLLATAGIAMGVAAFVLSSARDGAPRAHFVTADAGADVSQPAGDATSTDGDVQRPNGVNGVIGIAGASDAAAAASAGPARATADPTDAGVEARQTASEPADAGLDATPGSATPSRSAVAAGSEAVTVLGAAPGPAATRSGASGSVANLATQLRGGTAERLGGNGGGSRGAGTASGAGPASASGERLVVFAPSPRGVSISVDGRPARPFGPSYREERLTVGRHEIVFVGDEDCCEEGRFELNLPPGDEPYVFARSLAFRPARLYVSGPPADVAIDGRVVGRTRQFLTIPLGEFSRRVTLTVTAPGYRAYTGVVELRAGRVTEFPVSLEATGGGP